MQRHLAAFKSAAARIAAAGFLSLVAGSRSLTKLRPNTAANSYFAVPRTARWAQVRETRQSQRARSRFARWLATTAGFLTRFAALGNFFRHFPYSTTSTRWRTLWIMPRTDGVS